MDARTDDQLTAFFAWRKRRALEAGLFRPEQLLDEWVFRRILLHSPRDVYELEKLNLLTGPLYLQYGEDLVALSQGRPVEDERPRRLRLQDEQRESRATASRRPSDRPRRQDPSPSHHGVRADDPPLSLASVRSDKKSISDFEPAPHRSAWKNREFEFGCSTLSFKFWETEFLGEWGALLDALATGAESPASPDEESVAALHGRTRKAAKEWEQAYVKLVLRRSYEAS